MLEIACRIPLLVILSVVPQCAIEIMMREEELIRRVLIESAENTVVSDECFKLSSQGVALDPVHHVTTIACTECYRSARIDIGDAGLDVFEAFDEVDIWSTSPLILDTILERHSVTRASRWIRSYNYIPLLCENGRVPPRRPSLIPRPLRTSMDQKGERIFLGLIEIRRFEYPSMYTEILCSCEPKLINLVL